MIGSKTDARHLEHSERRRWPNLQQKTRGKLQMLVLAIASSLLSVEAMPFADYMNSNSNWNWNLNSNSNSNSLDEFMSSQVASVEPLMLCMGLQQEPHTMPNVSEVATDFGGPQNELSKQMDELAERLLVGLEGPAGDRLRTSLRDALQLDELLESDSGLLDNRSIHRELGLDEVSKATENLLPSRASANKIDHMTAALSVYHKELRIFGRSQVKRPARWRSSQDLSSRDLERLKQQVIGKLHELAPDEQSSLKAALLEAYDDVSGDGDTDNQGADSESALQNDDQEHSQTRRRKRDLGLLMGHAITETIKFGPKALLHLVDRTVEFGLELLDSIALTSDYLAMVPFVGRGILALRAKGEPIWRIVEHVRRIHYLFKVAHCPKIAELSKTELEFCERHYDETRVRETRQMLTSKGSQALANVAVALVREKFSSKKVPTCLIKLVARRAAFVLLSYALPLTVSPSCEPSLLKFGITGFL